MGEAGDRRLNMHTVRLQTYRPDTDKDTRAGSGHRDTDHRDAGHTYRQGIDTDVCRQNRNTQTR